MTWQLHSGSGAPGTIAGQTSGDNYIDYTTGDLYQLSGSSWSKIATWPKTSEAMLSLSDVTTGDADGTKHGLEEKAPNDLTKFRVGDASWKQFGGIAVNTSSVATSGTDETTIISVAIPANMMRAGTTYRVTASGVFSSGTSSNNTTARVRIGSSSGAGNIAATLSHDVGNANTNKPFLYTALVTIQSSGASGKALGYIKAENVYGDTDPIGQVTTPVDADTTGQLYVSFTVRSGYNSDVFTFYNAIIEVVKI